MKAKSAFVFMVAAISAMLVALFLTFSAPSQRSHFVDWMGPVMSIVGLVVLLMFGAIAGVGFFRADEVEDGTGRGGSYFLGGVIAAATGVLVLVLVLLARILGNAMIFSGV